MATKNSSINEKGILNKVLAAMPEKGQRVVRALQAGYTQLEVSRMTGLSQVSVSYYQNIFRANAAMALGNWAV